jgi:hypothetical protein
MTIHAREHITVVPPLWLDEADALDRVRVARANRQIPDSYAAAARHLVEAGFTIIRNVVSASLCDQVTDNFCQLFR